VKRRSWLAPLAALRHRRRARDPKPATPPAPVTPAPAGVLRVVRVAALWAIATVITAASGASFTESYRGLWLWARHHGLAGFWAAAFPVQVDAFIVVGELVLLVAMIDRWTWRERAGAWSVALVGLAVSIAGNIGHVAAHDVQSRGTAAIPPVAAFAALWLGLTVLKRVLARHATQDDAPTEVRTLLLPEVPTDAEAAAVIALRATTWAGNPLSGRQLEARFGLTRAQATKVRQAVDGEPKPTPADDDTEAAA